MWDMESILSGDINLEAIKKELGQAIKQAAEEEHCQITKLEEAREPNLWLCQVGWVDYLGHLDRKALRELVAPVKEDKPGLQILCMAFDWLIQDAQYHAVRKVVGLEALFEANKKEVDKETQMPFNSWMDITTVKTYTDDNEYQSVLISGLAVLGMREDDGWLDAEDYTPKYSVMIKLARLMVVQEAYERRQVEITKYEAQGLSPKQARTAANSYYRLTRNII
ncbi:hypothetical protein B0J14DRAFT_555754 [Halenospora varia]|nr:hypothetical protein B0J14DRAFT_555754 [Halenospora varia]